MKFTFPPWLQGISNLVQGFATKPSIYPLLQSQINRCKTPEQLLGLLHATPEKDEIIMDAFDRRFQELEQAA